MSVLEAVREYLSALPGLEGLALDTLGRAPGDLCLRPVSGEPVIQTYLDGSTRRQEQYYLWARRSYDEDRAEDGQWISGLAETLERRTRQGLLPELGPGKRAWSLLAVDTAAPELLLEDGVLVDQLTLRLTYFMEG